MGKSAIILEQFIKSGDKVQVVFDHSDEGWHYRRPQERALEGLVGTVVGFRTYTSYVARVGSDAKRHGTYECLGLPLVMFENGSGDYISAHNLCWAENHEAMNKLRGEELRDARGHAPDRVRVRTGDLPDLPIWEDDLVRIKLPRDEELHGAQARVSRIDWTAYGAKRMDGSPMPMFHFEFNFGRISLDITQFEFVAEGRVRKHFRGEKLSFASLEDELKFFSSLGHMKEIRNPANDLYLWTKEEALAALQLGLGHSLSRGSIMGGELRDDVWLCDDPDLGERVRQETLRGFGLEDLRQ